jgi:hypothetical protein
MGIQNLLHYKSVEVEFLRRNKEGINMKRFAYIALLVVVAVAFVGCRMAIGIG